MLRAGGVADAAAQDSFCAGTTCVITTVYDQSGHGNNLGYQGPGGAGRADTAASATSESLTVGGDKAYSLYINPGNSYWRDGHLTGVPTGSAPEGAYMVTSGTHVNSGCCFDYGNSETDRKADGAGAMDAINFGTSCWFGGCSGTGPWVQADLEYGLYPGGSQSWNPNQRAFTSHFVTAMLKNNGTTQIRAQGRQRPVRQPDHALGRRTAQRVQPDEEAGRDHPRQRRRLLHDGNTNPARAPSTRAPSSRATPPTPPTTRSRPTSPRPATDPAPPGQYRHSHQPRRAERHRGHRDQPPADPGHRLRLRAGPDIHRRRAPPRPCDQLLRTDHRNPHRHGTYSVTVSATDSTGAKGTASFTWTVRGQRLHRGDRPCHVAYTKSSEWPGGFTADLTIGNTGATPVNGWSLTFSFPGDQKVTNGWNATVSQSGNSVTATNAAYNATITPAAALPSASRARTPPATPHRPPSL